MRLMNRFRKQKDVLDILTNSLIFQGVKTTYTKGLPMLLLMMLFFSGQAHATEAGAYASAIQYRLDRDDESTAIKRIYLVCTDPGQKDDKSQNCDHYQVKLQNGNIPSFLPVKHPETFMDQKFVVGSLEKDFEDFAKRFYPKDKQLKKVSKQLYKLFGTSDAPIVVTDEDTFNEVDEFFENLPELILNGKSVSFAYAENTDDKSRLFFRCSKIAGVDQECPALDVIRSTPGKERVTLKTISMDEFKTFELEPLPTLRATKALFNDAIPAVTKSMIVHNWTPNPPTDSKGGNVFFHVIGRLFVGETEAYAVVVSVLSTVGALTWVTESITGAAPKAIINRKVDKSIHHLKAGAVIYLNDSNFNRLVDVFTGTKKAEPAETEAKKK